MGGWGWMGGSRPVCYHVLEPWGRCSAENRVQRERVMVHNFYLQPILTQKTQCVIFRTPLHGQFKKYSDALCAPRRRLLRIGLTHPHTPRYTYPVRCARPADRHAHAHPSVQCSRVRGGCHTRHTRQAPRLPRQRLDAGSTPDHRRTPVFLTPPPVCPGRDPRFVILSVFFNTPKRPDAGSTPDHRQTPVFLNTTPCVP
jgi:hypothetical protein